jgi:hypothetical protein
MVTTWMRDANKKERRQGFVILALPFLALGVAAVWRSC